MRARHASVSITYAQANITSEVKEDCESFTWQDVAEGGSDSVDLTLICLDTKWLGNWMPKKYSRVDAAINVEDWEREGDNRSINCGAYYLDDLGYSETPLTMKLGAVSTPVAASFTTTERTQTWENVTLRQIAQTIAGRSGLGLYYDGPDYTIEHIEQTDVDSSFLLDTARRYGLYMKIYTDRLILYDREAYKAGAAVRTIRRTDMDSWNWNTTVVGAYTGGQIDYTDQDKDADIHAQIGTGGRWLKLNQSCSSVADAGAQLAAALNKENHGVTTISFNLMGDPGLVAGMNVAVQGLGSLDGKYFLDEVNHTLDSSGYKTSCKATLCTPAFSASEASGVMTYNPSQHDTYADNYKSTYKQIQGGTPATTTAASSKAAASKAAASGTAGRAVTLKNCPLYYTSVIKTKSNTVTGTYYLYDGINVKGRYRITKPASRCGKKPIGKNVTGWIDAKYVT